MRGAWIIAAAVIVGALIPGAARAGVYFTSGTMVREWAQPDDPIAQELWPWASDNFSEFQNDLAAYRAAAADIPNRIATGLWWLGEAAGPWECGLPLPLLGSMGAGSRFLVPPERSLGMHYLRRVVELERKESRGFLTLDDRINLGAYYIRLGRYEQAIRVLEPKAEQSRHFMLRANLATAYELAGIPERALSYRQLALSSWPTMYPGWDQLMVNSYRKAEQFHLTLLQLRQEEARLQPGRTGLRLDNLFPRLRFVGPSGAYEAGTIAPAQWAEMPREATPLVKQLLLWMPFDDRLHWLLGELLNAQGNVFGAVAMMKPVVEKPQQDPRKWDAGVPVELREHYRILVAAAAEADRYYNNEVRRNHPNWDLVLLWQVAPRGTGLGVGDALHTAAGLAVLELPATSVTKPIPPPEPAAPTVTESWMPNWRPLAVGFGAGAVIALLLAMQFRQMGRAKG